MRDEKKKKCFRKNKDNREFLKIPLDLSSDVEEEKEMGGMPSAVENTSDNEADQIWHIVAKSRKEKKPEPSSSLLEQIASMSVSQAKKLSELKRTGMPKFPNDPNRCRFCTGFHNNSKCSGNGSPSALQDPPSSPRCNVCRALGHYAWACPFLHPDVIQLLCSGVDCCYNCGSKEHAFQHCKKAYYDPKIEPRVRHLLGIDSSTISPIDTAACPNFCGIKFGLEKPFPKTHARACPKKNGKPRGRGTSMGGRR